MPVFPRGQWAIWGTSGYDAALWRAASPPVDPYRTLANGVVVGAGTTLRANLNLGSPGTDAIFAFAVGGAFDTDRQKWVGTQSTGHGAGGTNEVNEFDIATGTWSRSMNPTVELFSQDNVPWTIASGIPWLNIHLSGPLGFVDVNDHYAANGLIPTAGGAHAIFPNPSQQYGSVCYIPAPYHQIWTWGGTAYYDPAFGTNAIFTYDVIAKKWQLQSAEGLPNGTSGAFPAGACWDSTNLRVLFGDGQNIRAYDPAQPAGSRVTTVASYGPVTGTTNDETTAIWDPKRKRLVYFGGSAAGLQRYYDFSAGPSSNPSGVPFSITGVVPSISQGMGVLYDPIADRYIYFPGGNNISPVGSMISIHPDTFVGTLLSPNGGSVVPSTPNMGGAGSPGEGMWGRFFYASSIDAYVALPQASDASLFVFAPVRANSPQLWCSDLLNGPSTGNTDTSHGLPSGQDGAYVTVWGVWDPTSVTFTCGGVAPAFILYNGNAIPPHSPANLNNPWQKYQCAIIQVSHLASAGAGTIQASSNGQLSNTIPFTVKPGNIKYAAVGGAGTGAWSTPFGSIQALLDSLDTTDPTRSDVGYVLNGLNAPSGIAANGNTGTSSTQPQSQLALCAYPDADIQLGTTNAADALIVGTSGGAGNMTISKFKIRGTNVPGAQAITGRENCRFVGLEVEVPGGNGSSGAVGMFGSNIKFLASEATNCGADQSDTQYHTVYRYGRRDLTPGGQFLESGFEGAYCYFHQNKSVRAFNNFNAQGPSANPIGDADIHHCVFVDQTYAAVGYQAGCVGTNKARELIFIRCGQTAPGDGGFGCAVELAPSYPANYPGAILPISVELSGISSLNAGDFNSSGRGVLSIRSTSVWTFKMHNCIWDQENGIQYMTNTSDALGPDPTNRSNNLWRGAGAPPALDTASLTGDPLFVAPLAPNPDLHLQSGSPCRANGSSPGAIEVDFDATPRPAGPWDVGAYQFATGGGVVVNPPVLTLIAPPSISIFNTGFFLNIYGTNFLTGIVANWNGSPRNTIFVSPTQVLMFVQPTDLLAFGVFPITAVNPSSVVSNALNFTVVGVSVPGQLVVTKVF